MIDKSFYLSDPHNTPEAERLTGLAIDEIESVVGRFAPHSCRAGQLKGKVLSYLDGNVEIRKSFGNQLLWRKYE